MARQVELHRPYHQVVGSTGLDMHKYKTGKRNK